MFIFCFKFSGFLFLFFYLLLISPALLQCLYSLYCIDWNRYNHKEFIINLDVSSLHLFLVIMQLPSENCAGSHEIWWHPLWHFFIYFNTMRRDSKVIKKTGIFSSRPSFCFSIIRSPHCIFFPHFSLTCTIRHGACYWSYGYIFAGVFFYSFHFPIFMKEDLSINLLLFWLNLTIIANL